MKKLSKNFLNSNTIKVAQGLLGNFLIRRIGKKEIIALISETEAYHGSQDLASHASRGRTQRTEIMFGPAGFAYIYLIYGMYYCFNIVTGKKDFPAAVLIRGVKIINNSETITNNLYINGPGKVCRELKIDKRFNNENLLKSKKLFIAEDNKLLRKIYPQGFKIKKDKRIGIDYAGKYKDKPWRFIIE